MSTAPGRTWWAADAVGLERQHEVQRLSKYTSPKGFISLGPSEGSPAQGHRAGRSARG